MNRQPTHHAPIPDHDVLLRETNEILNRVGLSECTGFQSVEDLDSANPTVIGCVEKAPRYVVKAIFGYPDTLARQVDGANWMREHRDLPIPEHYGYAEGSDRLPLVVMEWLPGRQLRLAVQESNDPARISICRDWGRCTARINVTQGFPEDLLDHEAGRHNWGGVDEHFQMTLERATNLERVANWSVASCLRLKEYVTDRRDAYIGSQHRGLTKRDIFERDFLTIADPEPRVSGVLDWERVNMGYTPGDNITNYMRLQQRDLGHLWSHYCDGYERETGTPFVQDEAAEYYAAMRFLIAANNSQPRVEGLLADMIDGRPLPFEDRA